jgi:ABC-type antimicrobial peptide transport system permease subunit
MENSMKAKNKPIFVFPRKKSGNFLLVLSFVITLFASLALNSSALSSLLSNLDYADYPQEYSVYNLLYKDNFEKFMDENFEGFDYETFYCDSNTSSLTTNIVSKNISIQIVGCRQNFERFPIPSAYSNSITSTSLIEGRSFSDIDLIQENNAMVMYCSHLEKINYKIGDTIVINGQPFVLKGVLDDSPDIKRNREKNVIQIFIPYTTFMNYFSFPVVKSVIYTKNYNFPLFSNDENFVSYYKIVDQVNASAELNDQTSFVSIIGLFAISSIATIILQILLIRGRYNEIGIRRAIGASRDSIAYFFTKESLLVLFLGVSLGLTVFLIIYSSICLILSSVFYTCLIVFNISATLIAATSYLLISFISVLIPSIIGTNINISTILVEEK